MNTLCIFVSCSRAAQSSPRCMKRDLDTRLLPCLDTRHNLSRSINGSNSLQSDHSKAWKQAFSSLLRAHLFLLSTLGLQTVALQWCLVTRNKQYINNRNYDGTSRNYKEVRTDMFAIASLNFLAYNCTAKQDWPGVIKMHPVLAGSKSENVTANLYLLKINKGRNELRGKAQGIAFEPFWKQPKAGSPVLRSLGA